MKTTFFCVLFVLSVMLLIPCISYAGMWIGISPSSYGASYLPPVILENGDTTLYEFSFYGSFGNSSDCQIVPYVSLSPVYSSDELFFSLDPDELVTEKSWEAQSCPAGQTLVFPFTVYISNPHLEPTLPGKYYMLTAWWSPYLESTGGIGIRGSAGGQVRMQVTPEPATLLLFSLGGSLLRTRKVRS